jgi:hypothetical protein
VKAAVLTDGLSPILTAARTLASKFYEVTAVSIPIRRADAGVLRERMLPIAVGALL